MAGHAPFDARGPARRARDRAAERARHSLPIHERFAALHEQAGALLEQLALHESDPARVDALTVAADRERRYAAAARARADDLRDPLGTDDVEGDR